MSKPALMVCAMMGFILVASSRPGFPSTDMAPKRWDFRVFLDDKEIGYHTVNIRPESGAQRVQVDAQFKVDFLFFTAFSYQHRAEELWQLGCLKTVETRTVTNGNEQFIESKALPKGIQLLTHDGEKTLGGCLRSFAYWNPDLLKTTTLLNTQTGELENTKLETIGTEDIEIGGVSMTAERIALTANEKRIDLWYSPDGEWLQLKSRVKRDRLLSYYRTELPS